MAVDSLEGTQGRQPLRLKKTFTFEDNTLTVDFELELLTGPSWEGWFTSEVHLSYPVPSQVSGTCVGEPSEADGYTVTDEAKRTSQVWIWEPRASVSFEAGRLAPRWWMILHPGETWRARISLGLLREE